MWGGAAHYLEDEEGMKEWIPGEGDVPLVQWEPGVGIIPDVLSRNPEKRRTKGEFQKTGLCSAPPVGPWAQGTGHYSSPSNAQRMRR